MKTVVLSICLICCFWGTYANAGWMDKQGNPVPDAENMKSVGNLIALLILSDKEQQIFRNWRTPSESVYFPTIDTIERNKILTAVIVFAGCAENIKGNCDLVVQFTVFNPDNTLYSKLPVMEVWSGKPNPPNNSLGLGVEYMRIIIEPGEQLGKYRLDAQIHDRHSGNRMLL